MTKLTEPEVITIESYNKAAWKWAAQNSRPRFWGEDFEIFHELLPEGRLLEVGCGAGRDAKELIAMGYDYTGTDISMPMLEEARKAIPKGRFLHKNLYELDFDEPFDGLWCAAVLLHVPKVRINEALASIRHSLVEGAIGYLSMKEGKGEGVEQRPELLDANIFFSYWEKDEFKDVLKSNGYETVYESYKPMSRRTKWLSYIVKTVPLPASSVTI